MKQVLLLAILIVSTVSITSMQNSNIDTIRQGALLIANLEILNIDCITDKKLENAINRHPELHKYAKKTRINVINPNPVELADNLLAYMVPVCNGFAIRAALNNDYPLSGMYTGLALNNAKIREHNINCLIGKLDKNY
jgi:hypothetical protein